LSHQKIYKICSTQQHKEFEADGKFTARGIDLEDGFIHFSTAEQLASTLHLHFNKQQNLTLIEVDTSDLDIVYEEARNGQLFPHLYGVLSYAHVTHIWALALDENEIHILPPLTPS